MSTLENAIANIVNLSSLSFLSAEVSRKRAAVMFYHSKGGIQTLIQTNIVLASQRPYKGGTQTLIEKHILLAKVMF